VSALTNFLKMAQGIVPVGKIIQCKQYVGLADGDTIVVRKDGFFTDSSVIDEYAVLAFHVDCAILVFVLIVMNLHVFAGDFRVKYLDWKGLVSANHICPLTKGIVVTLARPGYYDD
jgi:hypothetical protein